MAYGLKASSCDPLTLDLTRLYLRLKSSVMLVALYLVLIQFDTDSTY